MEKQVTRYQFDGVEVQPAAFAVSRNGRPLDLEPKAVRVLLYLMEHRDRAVTKEELIGAVWEGAAVSDNALTRVVAQIRRELGDDARQARYIQTLPTTGYRFIAALNVPARETAAVAAKPRPLRRRILALLLGAPLIAAGAWLLFSRSNPTPGAARKAVQVTTAAALDIGASFGPGGKTFVFSSNRSGWFEIYRAQVDGSGSAMRVTTDEKQNIDPSWSPDGKWIAYHSVAQHGIWVIPAAGGEARRLTAFGSSPAWSPDSKQIAFRSTEPISFAWFDTGGTGPSTIWTVAADGSRLQRQTAPFSPPGQHGEPSWSADGKRIVFVALAPESAIWSVAPDSGQLDLLVKVGRDLPRQPGTWFTRLWDPRLGPSGKLYFSAMSGIGEYGLYVQPRPGVLPQEIYSTGSEVPSGLAISADGRHLLFTQFWNISQLWTVGPDGDPRPLFQESVTRANLPRFSPDGKRLAFLVEAAGRNRDLWAMNADGSGAAPVSSDSGPKEALAWNRDGTGLLYNHVDGGQIEFRRYDPDRQSSRVLFRWSSASGLFHPVLMPNEREVLANCSPPLNVCIAPAAGGSPRQITFDREGAVYPNVSSDGEWITFELLRGETAQIAVVDRNGKQFEVLTNDPWLNWPYSFSSGNRRIAYSFYRAGVWNIGWIDRVTRERRQLTHYTAYGSFVRSPAWRPGTEELVYEYAQMKGNVYALALR